MPPLPTPQTNKRKRKPIGKPLPRSDAEIDALLAQPPTAAEQAEMISRAQRISPIFAAMLRATEDDNA